MCLPQMVGNGLRLAGGSHGLAGGLLQLYDPEDQVGSSEVQSEVLELSAWLLAFLLQG